MKVIPMQSRRVFLKNSTAAVGLSAVAGFPNLAVGSAATEKRLLFVILRGGLDGLTAVPPYADPNYRSARGTLAVPPPGARDGAIALDRQFGLHPALAPLMPFYRRGELLVMHALSIPEPTRSHFVAQDLLETGAPRGEPLRNGWLNRVLSHLPQTGSRLGLSVGYEIPTILRGNNPVASWAPSWLPEATPDLLDKLADIYQDDPLLSKALNEGRYAREMSERVIGGNDVMRRGNLRRERQFGTLAEAAARLLAAPDGARLAVIEMGGWDTHTNQVNRLQRNLQLLGNGLAVIPKSLGTAWKDTVVVVATEFGRTVRANGTKGTDHGTASAALVLGGSVAGGRVATDWPSLAPDRLYKNRDLAATADIRGLFKAVLRDHFGLSHIDVERSIFPDSANAKPPPGKIIS
ncbi:MAG: DUF1501 domain-containing protein [Pseudomonadota bacterium]|nr:DUF1501 domain-containing protein [Pseudomonadota bacterium]